MLTPAPTPAELAQSVREVSAGFRIVKGPLGHQRKSIAQALGCTVVPVSCVSGCGGVFSPTHGPPTGI